MSEDDLSLVFLDKNSYDEELQYRNVRFLWVKADNHHVWLDGTHYIGVGTPDTVNEGDLFFAPIPERVVHKVVSIDDSVPPSEPGVEIEVLRGPVHEMGETFTDYTSINELTGNIERLAMGDPGPPTLLKEVTEYKHEGENQE